MFVTIESVAAQLAAANISTTYRITTATSTITPMIAPLPHDFARRGRLSFHTSHRISPTTGKKKHSTAKPALLPSCSSVFGYAL